MTAGCDQLVHESLREWAATADASPDAVARVSPSRQPHRARWVAGGGGPGRRCDGDGGGRARGTGGPCPAGTRRRWRATRRRSRRTGGHGVVAGTDGGPCRPDWGYGGAPGADGVACFPSAMKAADGSDQRDESGPYVGRPISGTDVCVGDVDDGPNPTAPYVWLGAGVAAGDRRPRRRLGPRDRRGRGDGR